MNTQHINNERQQAQHSQSQSPVDNNKYYTNPPKITAAQYSKAIERRYNGEKLSSIASDLGLSTQALSKRFIKDKVIPAKAIQYPITNVLDNITSPIDPKNVNIYRNLTSREIAKIIDKLTLFSFKDATNKQIISLKVFNHLCEMMDQVEKSKFRGSQYCLSLMNLAVKFLSTTPMNSSNEIIKTLNQYLKSIFTADQTISTGFQNDTDANETLAKVQKLDAHVTKLQQEQ